MVNSNPRLKLNHFRVFFFMSLLFVIFFPVMASALTPIARTDVVPYQRIEYGTTFNFGVAAFSKAGIDRVEFAISGQGYSGSTKTSSTMRMNTQLAHAEPAVPMASWPGVAEYFVEISSSEFTSNGFISVVPTVYGKDQGIRVLDSVTLIVEAMEPYTHNYAVVSGSAGDDGTGEANSQTLKFKTIGAAVAAAQTKNNGRSDGNIIYVEEGEYALGTAQTVTDNEWLTIKAANGANRNNVFINDPGSVRSTNLLKIDGVTLYSGGSEDYVLDNNGKNVWLNNCKLTSIGRWERTKGLSPNVFPVRGEEYVTNCYFYDVERGSEAFLVRNTTFQKICEDSLTNNALVINVRVEDIDNGSNDGETTYVHSDVYQNYNDGAVNRIVYNMYATNLHYQGLFLRNTASFSQDVAYVNIFIEMRERGTLGNAPGGLPPQLISGALYCDNPWDHVLLWHCSFPYREFNLYGISTKLTNASFIGNIFFELIENVAGAGKEPASLQPGNPNNNVCVYNHYKGSFTDVTGCNGNPQPDGCPNWNSKSPDSDAMGTITTGLTGLERYHPEVLDLGDVKTYIYFGYPLAETVLVNRLPSNLTGVLYDALGNLRDKNPDVGALEKNADSVQGSPAPPSNITHH